MKIFLKAYTSALVFLFAMASGFSCAQPAKEGCPKATPISPQAGQVLSDTRPLIGWAQTNGSGLARVIVEARTPEFELLQRIDTEAKGGVLRLPREITPYRANLTVSVSLPCDSKTENNSTSRWRFYIDAGLACAPPNWLAYEPETGQLALSRSKGSDAVEVTVMSAEDGKEMTRVTTPRTYIDLSKVKGLNVVAIGRSRCGAALSAPAFTYLAL